RGGGVWWWVGVWGGGWRGGRGRGAGGEWPRQPPKRPARACGRKLVVQVHDAIRDLDEPHAGRPWAGDGKGRRHGVEQRQRKGCTCAAQERSPVYEFPGNNHLLMLLSFESSGTACS